MFPVNFLCTLLSVSFSVIPSIPCPFPRAFFREDPREDPRQFPVISPYVPCPFYSAFPCSFRCTRPSVFPQRVFGGLPPMVPLHLLWVLFAFARLLAFHRTYPLQSWCIPLCSLCVPLLVPDWFLSTFPVHSFVCLALYFFVRYIPE